MAGKALAEPRLKWKRYSTDRRPARSRFLLLALSVWVMVAPQARGQEPLTAAESQRIEPFLDSDHSPALLNCSIHAREPFLDFAFRFDVGYVFSCPLRAFGGRATAIWAFTRVTPEGGKPLILGQSYRLPEISPDQAAATNNRKLKGQVEASGGLSVGEGRYRVDLLLVDSGTGRTSRKSWRVRAARRHREQAVPVAVPPATVMPIAFQPWQGKLDTSGNGLRLSILLDAAPINPRAQKLRAWDRAFLLGSLSALLTQIPCASVRLVAFNFAQQREVFREEQFDAEGFLKLAEALRTLELGTISYRVLQKRHGSLEMLVDFANREVTSAKPSDAVILLGPATFYDEQVPRRMLEAHDTPHPHFCYFEYFPSYLKWIGVRPNTLHNLTKRLDGSVYTIQSPGDLARAVQRMLARVQPNGRASVDSD
ncbi:MAG: hypothetical protein LAN62_15275 [Acidobacteriia bacterium]|nr:hypothetical protein [Terriglobia bacterium]